MRCSASTHPDGSERKRLAPGAVWTVFLGVALLSGLINILYLTGSLFMLEVYDRVLPSRSVPTLIGLAAIVLGLYAFQGFFDLMRGRLLVRAGSAVDQALARRCYEAVVQTPLTVSQPKDGLQPLRDLDQVRAFLSGSGPAALFDVPWAPLYLALCFAFHFWIGVAVLGGMLLLMLLTLATELLTRGPTRASAGAAATRNGLAEAGRRNAEVLRAMGMTSTTADLWQEVSHRHLQSQRRIADVTGGLGSLIKVVRLALQSLVLGIGAYLVIQGEATGGIMIASSILASRALAPVELAVGNWKGFVAARQSWRRLQACLAQGATKAVTVTLPSPKNSLGVEGICVTAPGDKRLLVRDVTFTLTAGQGLGVIGPSGSGKSSLIRALVGVWAPVRGKVKLDGASLDQWSPEWLGQHLGYLPQDVELFAGTVAQNIARFQADATSDSIIEAAQMAGVHDLICSLPEGYDTPIGEGGAALSAGQRQRVALARALYGQPFLIVLDEPNSNLDAEGEAALTSAIKQVRSRGAIVVIVAHRPSALAGVDQVLVMADGCARAFGPRDEVLQAIKQAPAKDKVARAIERSKSEPSSLKGAVAPLRIVKEGERAHS